MKLLELHILQSFPVSCLNCDDLGAPKTATFGGVTRARISSQCLKRAIRLYAKELQPRLYAANRSRLFTCEITRLLAPRLPEQAGALAKCAAHYLGKMDPKNNEKVKALIFLSPEEYRRMADLLASLSEAGRQELCEAFATLSSEELAEADREEEDEREEAGMQSTAPKPKSKGKPLTAQQFTQKVSGILKWPIKKAFGNSFVKDAADIAIFGRMIAADHSLTVEGAGLFSHALSTHRAEPDIDFFSAIDDLQPGKEIGAGMIGTLEFTSACYYRYAGLNLDLLFYQEGSKGRPPATLNCFAGEEHKQTRREIVEAFVRATILAVPGARKNSMNAHTLPGYVLGLVKQRGQPLQLVNAFEKPVSPRNGMMDGSIEALKNHHAQLKATWGIQPALEIAIPDRPLDEFCEELLARV